MKDHNPKLRQRSTLIMSEIIGTKKLMDIDFDELLPRVDKELVKSWEINNLSFGTTLRGISERHNKAVRGLKGLPKEGSNLAFFCFLVSCILFFCLLSFRVEIDICFFLFSIILFLPLLIWQLYRRPRQERAFYEILMESEPVLLDFKRDLAKINPKGEIVSIYNEYTIRRLLVDLAYNVLGAENLFDSVVRDKGHSHSDFKKAEHEVNEARVKLIRGRTAAKSFDLNFSNTELFNQAEAKMAGRVE